MVKNRTREREQEKSRVFSHEEIEEIRRLANNWFIGMASYDGSVDGEFLVECVAESTYRYLASKGRIKRDDK